MQAREISTLIFFDVETTGLFKDSRNNPLLNPNRCEENWRDRCKRLENLVNSDGNGNCYPKITEIAFVSVPLQLFREGIDAMKETLPAATVPIAVNVHVSQVDPRLSENEWMEYESERRRIPKIIRLSKSELTKKNSFQQEWPLFHHVIQMCPKPVCILAHNGLNYDFRILVHELRRANMLEKYPIPSQVYFLDTLPSFIDIERQFGREIELIARSIDWNLVISRGIASNINDFTNHFKEECVVDNKVESTKKKGDKTLSVQKTQIYMRKINGNSDANDANLPPMKGENGEQNIENGAKYKSRLVEAHPFDFMQKENWSFAKRKTLVAELFERNIQGEWNFDGHKYRRSLNEKGRFQLASMYERSFDAPCDAHRASADCEALIQVCLTYGEEFVDYLMANISPFPACFNTQISDG